jgi:hypothetical protein
VKLGAANGERSDKTRIGEIGVWILVLGTLLALPFRILSYGYLPNDDALRHAAKAVSAKAWPEILVLRPEVTIDHNPGWHVILGWAHRAVGLDARGLVQISVVLMFVLFACSPLAWLKRPEAWLAALALITLCFPYVADRAFIGRPLFLTMASTIAILCSWRGTNEQPSVSLLISATGLITLSTWIHGSWYLFALLPSAFVLAGYWRRGLYLGACWALGSVLGAVITGNPIEFLRQSALIPLWALGGEVPIEALVGEFLPLQQWGVPTLMLTVGVIVGHFGLRRRPGEILRDPAFILAVLGLVLGLRVVRFWLDWGIPALALWIARLLSEFKTLSAAPWNRVGLALVSAGALFLGIGSDRGSRWSQYAKLECLNARRPEHAQWVPEPGGVIYSPHLFVFYETFFTNPNANWRYIMGFEPTFMPAEDRAVYYELCRTRNAITGCKPWVNKMTQADRLVLRASPRTRPAIPELEWYYAAEYLWVGRKPR